MLETRLRTRLELSRCSSQELPNRKRGPRRISGPSRHPRRMECHSYQKKRENEARDDSQAPFIVVGVISNERIVNIKEITKIFKKKTPLR